MEINWKNVPNLLLALQELGLSLLAMVLLTLAIGIKLTLLLGRDPGWLGDFPVATLLVVIAVLVIFYLKWDEKEHTCSD